MRGFVAEFVRPCFPRLLATTCKRHRYSAGCLAIKSRRPVRSGSRIVVARSSLGGSPFALCLPCAAALTDQQVCLNVFINSGIETSNQARQCDPKDLTRSQKRCDRGGASSLDLLPVASRESEGKHILLGIAVTLPELSQPYSERTEESFLIWHILVCRRIRAK